MVCVEYCPNQRIIESPRKEVDSQLLDWFSVWELPGAIQNFRAGAIQSNGVIPPFDNG